MIWIAICASDEISSIICWKVWLAIFMSQLLYAKTQRVFYPSKWQQLVVNQRVSVLFLNHNSHIYCVCEDPNYVYYQNLETKVNAIIILELWLFSLELLIMVETILIQTRAICEICKIFWYLLHSHFMINTLIINKNALSMLAFEKMAIEQKALGGILSYIYIYINFI